MVVLKFRSMASPRRLWIVKRAQANDIGLQQRIVGYLSQGEDLEPEIPLLERNGIELIRSSIFLNLQEDTILASRFSLFETQYIAQ